MLLSNRPYGIGMTKRGSISLPRRVNHTPTQYQSHKNKNDHNWSISKSYIGVNINKNIMNTFAQYLQESHDPIHTVCAYCQKEGIPGHRKEDHPKGVRISHTICAPHLERELSNITRARPLQEGLWSWMKTTQEPPTPKRPQPTGPSEYHGMELRSGKIFSYQFPRHTSTSLAKKLIMINTLNKESKDAWKYWID